MSWIYGSQFPEIECRAISSEGNLDIEVIRVVLEDLVDGFRCEGDTSEEAHYHAELATWHMFFEDDFPGYEPVYIPLEERADEEEEQPLQPPEEQPVTSPVKAEEGDAIAYSENFPDGIVEELMSQFNPLLSKVDVFAALSAATGNIELARKVLAFRLSMDFTLQQPVDGQGAIPASTSGTGLEPTPASSASPPEAPSIPAPPVSLSSTTVPSQENLEAPPASSIVEQPVPNINDIQSTIASHPSEDTSVPSASTIIPFTRTYHSVPLGRAGGQLEGTAPQNIIWDLMQLGFTKEAVNQALFEARDDHRLARRYLLACRHNGKKYGADGDGYLGNHAQYFKALSESG